MLLIMLILLLDHDRLRIVCAVLQIYWRDKRKSQYKLGVPCIRKGGYGMGLWTSQWEQVPLKREDGNCFVTGNKIKEHSRGEKKWMPEVKVE